MHVHMMPGRGMPAGLGLLWDHRLNDVVVERSTARVKEHAVRPDECQADNAAMVEAVA